MICGTFVCKLVKCVCVLFVTVIGQVPLVFFAELPFFLVVVAADEVVESALVRTETNVHVIFFFFRYLSTLLILYDWCCCGGSRCSKVEPSFFL
jgi:hypothetical protein